MCVEQELAALGSAGRGLRQACLQIHDRPVPRWSFYPIWPPPEVARTVGKRLFDLQP
jgi:hypothetical protein